ncbi:MAG: tRNA 2-thiouridine(34) synthase MnmA [Peptococcaceae bacterium]|nr:tRNA 2-thiouridine(34) synthase MnmA [Peptococcaceae bacterium]MDH7525142.1 tRNA 2-thiouridine(34) synthase MnmA [Peptococcaceae bacterium]
MIEKRRINKGDRVVVAMSGGVDSSVACALLLEEGYDVIGVTMKTWECGTADLRENACCSTQAVQDARNVAERLGIPHYVVNFQELFAQKVIGYFIDEYLRGRTPNPCIACNRHIKFGALIKKARELEAAGIATGHYARIDFDERTGRYLLYRGDDRSKDQSYVLYNLTQEQLAWTIFPLGAYSKERIREKAAQLGLAVAKKPESQEICFIPDNDYKRFLENKAAAKEIKPGYFLDTKGKVIGKHKGLPYYTVGQRKGLGLAMGYPAYVVALDPENNNVIVGREEEIYREGLRARDNNFIALESLKQELDVEAKIRYGAEPARAVISPEEDGRVCVRFLQPQRAITPGQSVVYYRGDLVVGGGVIDEVFF